MNRKKFNTYKDHNAVDFIEDEYFIRWVKYPDEQSEQFWKMWLAKHPEKSEELILAKNIVLNLGYQHDPGLSEDDYVDMFEGVLKRSRIDHGKKWGSHFTFLPVLFKLVALLIIVLGVTFYFYDQTPLVDQTATSVSLIKKSPRGQKTITWLDDGTKIHINAGSFIQYPKEFTDSSRVVYVEGEAYFEVTKDAKRPFIVKTGSVQATVLGTAFNVRAYPDESKIAIAVEEGSVRVEHEDKPTSFSEHVLTQHQMTTFDTETNETLSTEVDPGDIFAWKEGVISFKQANINLIIVTLERWYGVTFVVNKELNMDKDFTFRYKNKPLSEILEGLGFAFGFQYEIADKEIIIY